MAKKIQRDPKSVALAQTILEQYQPETKEDVQDAMKDIFGPIFEAMLQGEMNAHLGYESNSHNYKETQNRRNGYGNKTLKTTYGEIPINVPRDRNATFEPQAIPKRTKDVSGIEDKVLSMYAKGMSQRDIADTIEDIYGFNISAETVSEITDSVITEVEEWQKRKLESVYPIIFIDATHFHVRDNGQIVQKAAYVVLGIDKDGMKKVLTITIGENESAKYWMTVLNELKNRGVQDILVLCTDGLTGLKEAISAIYPKIEYQRCIVHQIRNSLKYVPYTDRKELANDLKTVYKASTEEIGYTNLLELEEKWKNKYPGAIQSWIDNWDVLSVFFKFSAEIRKIMYTTNAIESLNSTYKRINKNRNVFPTNMSLLKVVYLSTLKAEKKWTRMVDNWDLCLSQFRIMYEGRI